jgi:hypothetical protein
MLKQPTRARRRTGVAIALTERRSIASLEFALVAPVMLTLSLATYDITRALLVWQQVSDAAEAIVENAEKLSVTQDPQTGAVTAELTPAQMQQAMSTIYAQMPGIFPGRPVSPLGGLFPGSFAVTLSSIEFAPLCDPNAKPACTLANNPLQLPFTVWSSFLTRGDDNGQINLIQQPNRDHPVLLRPCSPDGKTPVMQGVTQFPNTLPAQYATMMDPNVNPKNPAIILVPQLIADVQYTYTPSLSVFFGPVTFVASAALPAPIGQTNQVVALNGPGSANPVACPAITYTP